MKLKDNPNIKKYCYKGNKCGPIVLTGFHLQTFYSCKQCKEEVTEKIYQDYCKENEDNKQQDLWELL